MLDVNLLIVDDEPSTLFSLCQIFSCRGFNVRGADDGFSALKEIRQLVPDILLSDLNMPRMSGFELLSVVRRRFPGIYVIAMSGGSPGEAMPEGIAADAFYKKATGLSSLFKLVRAAKEPEPVPLRAARKFAPIWIPPAESRNSERKQVFIGCPECLRAFPHALGPGGSFQETNCAYCCTPINYAVVEQYAAIS
jgi:DNA-binding NtrC family response regulator